MIKRIPEYLFILEMANNHMGDLGHGINIIKIFGELCKKYPFNFAVKLQYRSLDTFIHPDMKNRLDIKYIKRFSETELNKSDFDQMIDEIRNQGLLTISTPFDENSVSLIESQDLDIIKIASCSFTDWPLLERIVKNEKPIIASTAGASIEDIDKVVSFLSHRKKEFALMHCVAQYPTPDENLNLSKIKYLQKRYPNTRIGFSTHENPSNTKFISMAIAMGANIFERHIGLPTVSYKINEYTSTPEQIDLWLKEALNSVAVCGLNNKKSKINNNENEKENLRTLRRGIYVNRLITKGEIIKDKDVYFAFPPQENQYTANNWSKYFQFKAAEDIKKNGPLKKDNTNYLNTREKVWEIVKKVRIFLKESQTVIPGGSELEISHHYGLENFDKFGLVMSTIVNRDYCKKLLLLFPGQTHPEQYHDKKEETFHILFGKIKLEIDGKYQIYSPGDVITILPKAKHIFSSETGAVIEEISTSHYKEDSYYTDPEIAKNVNRKTFISYWME